MTAIEFSINKSTQIVRIHKYNYKVGNFITFKSLLDNMIEKRSFVVTLLDFNIAQT